MRCPPKRWPGQHNMELKITVRGDGYRYRGRGYPQKVQDASYHVEYWKKQKDGTYTNEIRQRKSKKRHPDLPPIPPVSSA